MRNDPEADFNDLPLAKLYHINFKGPSESRPETKNDKGEGRVKRCLLLQYTRCCCVLSHVM
jgi:hypothetical protein